MTARPAPRLRTRLLALPGLVLLCALLIEGFARVAGLVVPPPPRTEGPSLLRPSKDPVLRFENNAGTASRQVYPLASGDELIADFSIDALGLRAGPGLAAKAPGTFRIACLGDSQTFGDGVSDDQTWPAHLARFLDPARAPVEVLNCGVNAYDTEQEVRRLESRVLPLEPDLVLLQFFLNDAAIRSVPGSGRVDGPAEVAPPGAGTGANAGWLGGLRSVSCFVDWCVERVESRAYLDELARSRSLLYAPDSAGWEACRGQLRRAQELLAGRGIALVVVLYPMLHGDREQLATHEAYAIVSAFLRDEGIRHLDLEAAFLGQELEALRVHPRNAHPNGEGHRIAAGAVATFLRGEGLVP